jgi:hypothetical protein
MARNFLYGDQTIGTYPSGPFVKALRRGIIIELGLSGNSKLCDVIQEGEWMWPPARSNQMDQESFFICNV